MIDHGYELIFLANRKTASVSVKVAMRGVDHTSSSFVEPGSCNHNTGEVVRNQHPRYFADYHKFTIVRNSYDRAESYFHYHKEAPHFKGSHFQNITFNEWVLNGCPAPEKLLELMEREGVHDDPLDQLRYADGADTVLLFENLAEEFGEFARIHELPTRELPHRNNFNRTREQWTPEAIASFTAQYSEEITRFRFEAPTSIST